MKTTQGLLLLLLLLSLAGCSGPLEPRLGAVAARLVSSSEARTDSPFFYPLDLGNRWEYRRVLTVSPGPTSDPFPPIVIRSQIEAVLLCVENGATSYVVERRTQTDTTVLGPRVSVQWIRYRQDKSGLYEADIALDQPASCAAAAPVEETPPIRESGVNDWLASSLTQSLRGATALRATDPARVARAAASIARRLSVANLASRPSASAGASGVNPGELTRLRYPMVAGSTWNVRTDPFLITSTNLGLERLALPAGEVPAYRVAIHIPSAFGPADRAHFWFGRTGWLREELHLEVGSDLGLMLVDETIELVDLSLEGGRF